MKSMKFLALLALTLGMTNLSTAQSTDFFELNSMPNIREMANKKVQVRIKNVATGNYILYQADPRGGGVLQSGPSENASVWHFYQHADAATGNVEIKVPKMEMFNWSNYDMNNNDANAFVAYNHAKRHPNNTTPAGPHDWTIEYVSDKSFRIKWKNGEYLEEVALATHLRNNSTGKKPVTRPDDISNKKQHWIIESNAPQLIGVHKIHAYSIYSSRAKGENFYWGVENGVGKIIDANAGKRPSSVEVINTTVGDRKAIMFRDKTSGKYFTVNSSKTLVLQDGKSDGAIFFPGAPRYTGEDVSLANGWLSFESKLFPNHYLRHAGFTLQVSTPSAGHFVQDATFSIHGK